MSAIIHKGKKIAETMNAPFRGIISQEDYDALPETDRNTGIWFIENTLDVTPVEKSSMEIYDDQEHVIGTWFGKPLYRVVVVDTFLLDATPTPYPDIETFVFGYGTTNINGTTQTIPGKSNSILYNSVDKTIRVTTNLSSEVGKPSTVVLLYTKTTDEAEETTE